MGYAVIADLTLYGTPASAIAGLSTEQKQAAIDNASTIVDSYLRGRYQLPLVSWGIEITEATIKIAAYNLLNIRGYNPAAGADVNIRQRYDDAISWLNKVQRQASHPDVKDSSVGIGQYSSPVVNSVSAISTFSNITGKNRGW